MNDDQLNANLSKIAATMQAELDNPKPLPRKAVKRVKIIMIGLSMLVVFGPAFGLVALGKPLMATLWLSIWMLERYVRLIMDWSK